MCTRIYEVQQKIYQQLNDSALSASVYDYVPENTATPYVTFGTINSLSTSDKIAHGETVTLTIDVWSMSKGRKETVTIISEIEEALMIDIELDTADVLAQKIISREVFEEQYGLYHGEIEIEVMIDWNE
ncbi:DUF3168 domain-containing protein [Bacillus sp. SJS]|uniref:DUF3168 domain-containing protein n=1 Tax=Bacillus sp. SJS TaxID=1423321 RepID=UPI0006908B77|nr:DUF3168 domain-containing protein [Bacillus sp. SJS]KZZ86228.1 hypothetical protein AS29_001240 [Bacillus sp. SJS]